MTRKGLWPAFCAVMVIALVGLNSCDFASPESVIEVDTMQVKRGEIFEVISASGKVAPEQTEVVTSDTNGEISEILIEEDDDVTKDQVIVNFEQLEPVKSSVAGSVLKVNCFRGQMAMVGTPLMTVGEEDTYLITSDTNGEINEILVELGDNVTKDQVIVNFEQLEPVKSPVAGSVLKVNCLPGQMVTVGTPLMTIYEEDTETIWQVTSDINGEISEVLVEGGEFIREILLDLGDDVTKDQVIVNFKQPEPVKSSVAGRVLRVDCLRGQMATVGTPLMIIGEEDTYLITSDTNGEINEILVELGDDVTEDQVVVNFEQPEPVKSPVAGRVLEVNCFEGQMITLGTPLMIIADTVPFYVVANVDEVDISKVKIDQSVMITLDAYPDVTLKGKLESINFSAIDTPVGGTVFPVKVEIISADDLDLLLGMTADIEIISATYEDVIVVPIEVVVRRDGKHAVFVVENSIAKRQEVELGICTDDFCEIKSGLREGQEIVTNNASSLEGGEKVTPVNAR